MSPKDRCIFTRISREIRPDKSIDYFVIVNGHKQKLSWYGTYLSPENTSSETMFAICQEIDSSYGNFLGWYIERIIG